jgi:hypothetical protein
MRNSNMFRHFRGARGRDNRAIVREIWTCSQYARQLRKLHPNGLGPGAGEFRRMPELRRKSAALDTQSHTTAAPFAIGFLETALAMEESSNGIWRNPITLRELPLGGRPPSRAALPLPQKVFRFIGTDWLASESVRLVLKTMKRKRLRSTSILDKAAPWTVP